MPGWNVVPNYKSLHAVGDLEWQRREKPINNWVSSQKEKMENTIANNMDKEKELHVDFEDGKIEGFFGEDVDIKELAVTFIKIANEIMIASKEAKKVTYVYCVNDRIYSGTDQKIRKEPTGFVTEVKDEESVYEPEF